MGRDDTLRITNVRLRGENAPERDYLVTAPDMVRR